MCIRDRRGQEFLEWWRAPTTRKDRIVGAIVGGLGCLWIGVLGRMMLGPMPITLVAIGWWALFSICIGVILGVSFPKYVTCICFPFSVFGVGGN